MSGTGLKKVQPSTWPGACGGAIAVMLQDDVSRRAARVAGDPASWRVVARRPLGEASSPGAPLPTRPTTPLMQALDDRSRTGLGASGGGLGLGTPGCRGHGETEPRSNSSGSTDLTPHACSPRTVVCNITRWPPPPSGRPSAGLHSSTGAAHEAGGSWCRPSLTTRRSVSPAYEWVRRWPGAGAGQGLHRVHRDRLLVPYCLDAIRGTRGPRQPRGYRPGHEARCGYRWGPSLPRLVGSTPPCSSPSDVRRVPEPR